MQQIKQHIKAKKQQYLMSDLYSTKVALNQPKVSSQQYTHLTVKQIKQEFDRMDIDLYTSLQQQLIPLTQQAHKLKQLQQNRKRQQQLVFNLIDKIKESSEEYQNLKQFIKDSLQQKAGSLSEMHTRKNTFMVDCVRELMSHPFKKDLTASFKKNASFEDVEYNFRPLWLKSMDKQLRRVVWAKMLLTQNSKKEFFVHDKELSPFNIEPQFRLTLEKIKKQEELKLKELQNDMVIKVLQYLVKRNQIIPSKTQLYLTLTLVDLFNYYNVTKLNEIGAMYVSLENMAAWYFEPSVQVRMSHLLRVIELIDERTFSILQETFFSERLDQIIVNKNKAELNQIYEHFRLSLGSKYLPIQSGQFLIDQLLIKKRHKFDIYILFGIMILVLGDHIEKVLANQNKLPSQNQIINNQGNSGQGNDSNLNKSNFPNGKDPKQTVKPNENLIQVKKVNFDDNLYKKDFSIRNLFENSKKLIKKQEIVEAFEVVFQKIPCHYSNDIQLSQPNHLLEFMIEYEDSFPQQESDNQKKLMDLEEEQQLYSQLETLKKLNYSKFAKNNFEDPIEEFVVQPTNSINQTLRTLKI